MVSNLHGFLSSITIIMDTCMEHDIRLIMIGLVCESWQNFWSYNSIWMISNGFRYWGYKFYWSVKCNQFFINVKAGWKWLSIMSDLDNIEGKIGNVRLIGLSMLIFVYLCSVYLSSYDYCECLVDYTLVVRHTCLIV